MINQVAQDHDCDDVSDALFELKNGTAQRAFKIGVFAGVIFTGCRKDQVDRFERGLAFSLQAHNRIVRAVE